jgi:hypothetical protein
MCRPASCARAVEHLDAAGEGRDRVAARSTAVADGDCGWGQPATRKEVHRTLAFHGALLDAEPIIPIDACGKSAADQAADLVVREWVGRPRPYCLAASVAARSEQGIAAAKDSPGPGGHLGERTPRRTTLPRALPRDCLALDTASCGRSPVPVAPRAYWRVDGGVMILSWGAEGGAVRPGEARQSE